MEDEQHDHSLDLFSISDNTSYPSYVLDMANNSENTSVPDYVDETPVELCSASNVNQLGSAIIPYFYYINFLLSYLGNWLVLFIIVKLELPRAGRGRTPSGRR
jgi:hypothetical protein